MLFVKIEDVKPGQQVAKDVTDPRGVLLFKAGAILTTELITRLKARMVTHLYLEDSVIGGLSEEEIKKRQDEIESEVESMFADIKGNPVMASLCESAKRYLKSKVK